MGAPEISQELAQRMAACLRAYAEGSGSSFASIMGKSVYAEALEIVAELPKPVDPDVLIVREILHAHQRAMSPPDSGWGNMSYRDGSYDKLPVFQAALAAYRVAMLK